MQNVKVARLWNNHQPIFWPDWSVVQYAMEAIDAKAGGAPHPADDLANIFEKQDRVAAYQDGPKGSLAGCDNGAGYALSYSFL